MKPWIINTIAIVLFIVLAIELSLLIPQKAGSILYFLILVSALWAYSDAKRLQIQKYKGDRFSPASTPGGVFAVCAILWVVGFPMYISYRAKIIEGKVPLKDPVT